MKASIGLRTHFAVFTSGGVGRTGALNDQCSVYSAPCSIHLRSSRPMLETVEQSTRPRVAWSVIWLHGLGADGHDFAPIVPELVREDWPGIRFVFPHAPVRAVTINNGVRMRAWYDIVGMDFPTRADSEGVDQ